MNAGVFLAVLVAATDAPAKYPVPPWAAKRAAELWKAEYEKQKPATEALVKGLRNATGKDGLAAKAAAEKTLKRMGSEPFYVAALRVHDDQWGDTVDGRLGCLKSSDVTVIKDHPDGWIGKITFRGGGGIGGGFIVRGGADIPASFLFVEPYPGKSKIGKTFERTGVYYAHAAADKDAFWRAVLVPVVIDPKDAPVPPKK